MLNIKVQPATLEEKFMFGSPPLLNGFSYSTCRSQEGLLKTNHDCYSFNSDCLEGYQSEESLNSEAATGMKRKPYLQPKFPVIGYGRSHPTIPTPINGRQNVGSVTENLSQLNFNNNRGSHVDNGIKILEHAGIKIQQKQTEPVFKKRKDLRVLKSALSNERFREVAVKFGDGDEGGKEISESVHRSMIDINSTQVTCLYCKTVSQVYENFPMVDGTLFLSPVNLSRDCVPFADNASGSSQRFMGFICVSCMEGKPRTLCCSGCSTPWKGSFFQVGTMYSYDILSATPCCEKQVSCKKCEKPVIDIKKGEASTLFFSNFSTKSTCLHCGIEDFHFVKPLSMFTLSEL